MAQRAKKILQEEGSHRVHGEAWAKRLCRGDASATRSSTGCEETWAQAARWIGPDDDPAYAAALEAGEVKQTAAHQRELMRDWLTALLGAEGVAIDARRADGLRPAGTPERRRMTCPFCDSRRASSASASGAARSSPPSGAASACSSYFEAVREDFDDAPGEAA